MVHESTTDLTMQRLDEAIAALDRAWHALEDRVATMERRNNEDAEAEPKGPDLA